MSLVGSPVTCPECGETLGENGDECGTCEAWAERVAICFFDGELEAAVAVDVANAAVDS